MPKRLAFVRASTLFLAGAALLLAVSCATTPKTPTPEPTPEPVTNPTPTPEPTPQPNPTKTEPITDAEFAAADAAIDQAKAAGAETEAADLLAQARAALADAHSESDIAKARGSLQTAIDKAYAARDLAYATRIARLDQEAGQAIDEAVNAGAEENGQDVADLLNEAREARSDGLAQATSAPETALTLLQKAIDRAHQARDAAGDAKVQAELAQLAQQAQDAIAEAEAVEADQYAPDTLNQARQALSVGQTKAKSDPDSARTLLQEAIDQAHAARDAAAGARTEALLGRIDASAARLTALQPDKWDPDGTRTVLDQADSARSAVAANYEAGLPLANEAIAALDEAATRLGNRLLAVQDLRVQAQKSLDDADATDAMVWAADLVQSANDAVFQGTGAWKKYQLDAAEEAWNTALFQAKSAAAKAALEVKRKQTEQLMLDTMKKLQDASGKTVVGPQDQIIAPKPWDGTKELEKLKSKPVGVLLPADGSVVVLGEVQRVTYLDEAKDQWAQGVEAFNAGDLTLANESFLQAQKLIDTYLALAVDKVYTVRLIPERRDSLWRISEYGDIYATPWDWPKIWKRNQKLIQNPDLIYPGWQLIIPPQ